MQFSNYQFQQMLTAINNLMVRGNVQPQLQKALMDGILSGQYQQDLFAHMLRSLPPDRWSAGGGVHIEQIENAVLPWINHYLGQLDNQLRMQQQQRGVYPGMPMGGMQPGYGMGPANIYTSPAQPMFATPVNTGAYYADPVATTQIAPTPSYPETTTIMKEPVMAVQVPATVRLEKASQVGIGTMKNGSVAVDEYRQGEYNDGRVSLTTLTQKRCTNSPLEAYRDVYRVIPTELVRGHWVHVVSYNQLVHVPMATGSFTRICREVEEVLNKEGWSAAIALLRKGSVEEWTIHSDVLVKRINNLLRRYLRRTVGKSYKISINNLSELEELANPNSKVLPDSLTTHPAYDVVINQIFTVAFSEVYNTGNIIGAEDPHFGDFIKCADVMYHDDQDHSEYDYGVMTEVADRKAFIGKLLSEHTVLRIKRQFLATDALSDDVINMCVSGKTLTSTDTDPLFSALMGELKTSTLKNMEQVICLRPKTSINEHAVVLHVGSTMDNDMIIIPTA